MSVLLYQLFLYYIIYKANITNLDYFYILFTTLIPILLFTLLLKFYLPFSCLFY